MFLSNLIILSIYFDKPTRKGLLGSSSANCGVAGALSLRFLNKLIFNNSYDSNKKYTKVRSIAVH